MRRFGFTLMEVNLAMFIMAMGTLGLIGLYSFGYRENQQSNEDVQAAALSELYMNAMVAALSSTNMTWDAWQSIGTCPARGWGEYAGDGTDTGLSDDDGDKASEPLDSSGCNVEAGKVFNKVMSAAGFSVRFEPPSMTVGIVVAPGDERKRTYSVAVRCARRAATLVYQPLYYAEVYFQGLRKDGE